MNLVGTGTSVRSPITDALFRRTNAEMLLSRKSTSPTRMLLASAPWGIFFINWTLCCGRSPFMFPKSLVLWFLLCIDRELELFFSTPSEPGNRFCYGTHDGPRKIARTKQESGKLAIWFGKLRTVI